MKPENLDELCINTIRFLAVDAIEKAKSGHPGMVLGSAPAAYVLWDRFLRHNPSNPSWPDRDRFVLSAGHASMLLYSLLYLTGYKMTLEDIESFRQWGSVTPGHPERDMARGIETTTGPLGQGFATAVGMAMAEAHLAARYNCRGHEIVHHHTYVLASDGDMMEGISHEAASLAGHLRLGRLIVLYDSNHVSIEGSTSLAFTEDVAARFRAYGWHVLNVGDGNDLEAIEGAIAKAREREDAPSLILIRSHIGYGSPKQDLASAHGAPLGSGAARATKERLGWPLEPEFYVPDEALVHMRRALARGAAWEQEWRGNLAAWKSECPNKAAGWEPAMSNSLPEKWDAGLPLFTPDDPPLATRKASGEAINALAKRIPFLVGGSADLAPSTKTYIAGMGDFEPGSYGGRNFHFGVREHAMGAALNGIAEHGGLRVFGGTFLVFSDYMRPAIRLAAMMRLPVIYVFTHDSIGIGEDGPTHQPVEQIPSLRAIPGLVVMRPADARETVEAWRWAMEWENGPVALVLTRQSLPILSADEKIIEQGIRRGAYVLADPSGSPDVILIATGSEVSLALRAKDALAKEKIATRVVSMPSWELFAAQPKEYRERILPGRVRARVAIEAAAPIGWERWVGGAGRVIGLDRFGASAPGKIAMERLGFNVENVLKTVHSVLSNVSL